MTRMQSGLISVEGILAEAESGAFQYNRSTPRSVLFVNAKRNICVPIEDQITADLGFEAD